MAKHPPIGRSISMSQIPKRSISIQSNQSAKGLPTESMLQKAANKTYKVLTRIMFTNRNEHAKKFDKSIINYFLYLLGFFGISWLTAKNLPRWSIVSIALYNGVVFLIQCIYLILLVIDFYISKISDYQWVTMSFYLYGILLILSVWLNIRIHLIRSNTIAESICSYSISSEFVRRKNRWLKIVCIAFILITFLCVLLFVFAHRFSNDLFGIESSKQNQTIFSCGLFCSTIFYYISVIIIVTLIGATGLFAFLTVSTLLEAKKLNEDIRKYPANDGLDHLIFRYQSIEQSVNAIDKHFSCIILGLVFLMISGGIIILRKYTKLMIGQWETGSVLLIFFYVFIGVMLVIFLVLGTILNERLLEFRRASQKVSDFQQIYTTNQNSIKLLSFMLRLSDTKETLKVGGIFAINRQTLFTLFLILLIGGFVLYSVDNDCMQIF